MKNLNSIIKKIDGSVLGIGIDSKIADILDNNKKVVECYLLNSNGNISNDGKGFSRVVRISKIKKVFRKKSFDYIICNLEDLRLYLRTFIKNSIYLGRGKIYFYGEVDIYDLDELENRYKRYGCNIIRQIDNNNFIIEINCENINTKLLNNIRFKVRDIFYDIFEYISDLLVK